MGKQKEAKEKPLEKMTATELREAAKEIEGITGTSGMNKAELLKAIREAKGIEEPATRKKKGDIRALKVKMRALKARREQAVESEDERMAEILRKKIIRLKKRTRRAA